MSSSLLFCRPCSSSSSPSNSSSNKFGEPKLNVTKNHFRQRRHRHLLCRRPPNLGCWIAFDIHPNLVYYLAIFEEDDVERTKAVEPIMLAKSIWTSIKACKMVRQQRAGWRMTELSALFGYVCALIDQQCAAEGESSCSVSPPPRIPANAIIVVPTNCSLPYQMAMEEAAGAAGFGQVHLICRATALAISYRMLFLDEALETALCSSPTSTTNPMSEMQTARTATAAAEEKDQLTTLEPAVELIVQLDDANKRDGREDKFVAILFVCEHCFQLTIYDFRPHHLPLLISSKMLHITDTKADIDLINKFLRHHLSTFRAKLSRLLTAGAPKLIASILPTIKKHIDCSCQLLSNRCPVPSDRLAIFGAALRGVHLMLNSKAASEDDDRAKASPFATDRSPLFLSRSMVPSFDYSVNNEQEEVMDDTLEQKLQKEIAAIDESFNKTFGLIEHKSSEESRKSIEMEEETCSSTSAAESDVTLLSENGLVPNDDAETEEASFFDVILSHEMNRQWMHKKKLTDDEKRVLADVVTNLGGVPSDDPIAATTSPHDDDDLLTPGHIAGTSAILQTNTVRRVVGEKEHDYTACVSAPLTTATITTTTNCGTADGSHEFATTSNAVCASSTNSASPSHTAGTRRCEHYCESVRCECIEITPASTATSQNCDNFDEIALPPTMVNNNNNKMRWEETDDDEEGEGMEMDEIATLGDDRSIIDGYQLHQGFFSSSDCPSGISSPSLPPSIGHNNHLFDQQNVAIDDDERTTITETLDDDNDNSTTITTTNAPTVQLNRWGQPVDIIHQWTYTTYEGLGQQLPTATTTRWKRTHGRKRGQIHQQQQQQQQTNVVRTMPTTTTAIERPNSRASTLQAMSDDDDNDGGGDVEQRQRTMPLTNNPSGVTRTGSYAAQLSTAVVEQAGSRRESGGCFSSTPFVVDHNDDGQRIDELLLPIFGSQRPLAGKFSASIEQQFYRPLPVCGQGALSSVQMVGLPLMWIGNKFFQQELKEWLRIRSGLRTKGLINGFISFSVASPAAFRICRLGRFSINPFNGDHNQLIVFLLLPTPEVAWHVCWACNQFEDDLGTYWPDKYGQLKFKPTVTMANRQTFLEDTYA